LKHGGRNVAIKYNPPVIYKILAANSNLILFKTIPYGSTGKTFTLVAAISMFEVE